MALSDPPVERKRRRRAYHSRLVAAFVQHHRLDDVCKAVGLSRTTVKRWKRVPEYWAEVEAARSQVKDEALALLRNGLPVAARTLVRVAEKASEDSIAVRASLGVFEAFARVDDRLQLEQRLAAIEERLAAAPSAEAPRPYLSPVLPRTHLGAYGQAPQQEAS